MINYSIIFLELLIVTYSRRPRMAKKSRSERRLESAALSKPVPQTPRQINALRKKALKKRSPLIGHKKLSRRSKSDASPFVVLMHRIELMLARGLTMHFNPCTPPPPQFFGECYESVEDARCPGLTVVMAADADSCSIALNITNRDSVAHDQLMAGLAASLQK